MKPKLFRTVSQYPEYKQYRTQQKKDFFFYFVINVALCAVGFCSKNKDISVVTEFIFTAFIISIFCLAIYTIKRPSIKQGYVYEKRKSGQTYIHTIKDSVDKYLCTYRTLGDSGFQENDSVFVLNESHLIKERKSSHEEINENHS